MIGADADPRAEDADPIRVRPPERRRQNEETTRGAPVAEIQGSPDDGGDAKVDPRA